MKMFENESIKIKVYWTGISMQESNTIVTPTIVNIFIFTYLYMIC